MFDLLTNPFVNLFLERINAEGSSSFIFLQPDFISITTLKIIFFIFSVLITSFTLFIKFEKEPKVIRNVLYTSLSIFIIVLISLLFNSNIVSKDNYKEILAEKCYMGKDFNSAFQLNPQIQIQSKEEVKAIEEYVNKNKAVHPNIYKSLSKVYTSGLEDLAKDDVLKMVYEIRYNESVENMAKSGNFTAITALIPKLNGFTLSSLLQNVKKDCDNAEKAYLSAERLKTEFEVNKKINQVDVNKTKEDIDKIEALTGWAYFSKKECIPVWNKFN